MSTPKFLYARDLAEHIAKMGGDVQAKLQTDLPTTLREMSQPPIDRSVYRIVVVSLGLAIVLSVIGALVLAMMGETFPSELLALGSAAVGAFAGLLAPSPSQAGS